MSYGAYGFQHGCLTEKETDRGERERENDGCMVTETIATTTGESDWSCTWKTSKIFTQSQGESVQTHQCLPFRTSVNYSLFNFFFISLFSSPFFLLFSPLLSPQFFIYCLLVYPAFIHLSFAGVVPVLTKKCLVISYIYFSATHPQARSGFINPASTQTHFTCLYVSLRSLLHMLQISFFLQLSFLSSLHTHPVISLPLPPERLHVFCFYLFPCHCISVSCLLSASFYVSIFPCFPPSALRVCLTTLLFF